MIDYGLRFHRAFRIWVDRDSSFMAAAIAFYASLSIIPFFAVSFTLIDTIVEATAVGRNTHDIIMQAVEEETSPQIRNALEDILKESRHRSRVEGPLTLIWLFVMSLIVFSRLDRAFERIWRGDRSQAASFVGAAKRAIKNRLRATVLFFGYSLGLVSTFVFSLVAQSIEHYSGFGVYSGVWTGWLAHSALAILLNTLFFQLLIMWLSRERIRWLDALHGAAYLSLSWELGRQALTLSIIGNQRSLYGVLGSFMAILLWTYYASALVLYWGGFVKCLFDDREKASASESDS